MVEMWNSRCKKKVKICQSNYSNIFYRTLIHDKNYSKWENAKISLDRMISNSIFSDYCINDGKCSECIENT